MLPGLPSPRRALRRFPGTALLSAALVGTLAAQVAVASAAGTAAMTRLFAAGAEPSPGWALAAFAHQGPGHLFVNLLLVVTYGAVVEAALGARRQVALFLGAGWLATAAQVVGYRFTDAVGPAAGASGSALAFVAAVAVVTLARIDRESVGHPVHVLGIGGAVFLAVQTGIDALAGNPALLAHLVGATVGALAGAWSVERGVVSTEPVRRTETESDAPCDD